MMAFARVPDRVRLAGKINFNSEKEKYPEELRWHGKTITIFLLWMFGSLASVAMFANECGLRRLQNATESLLIYHKRFMNYATILTATVTIRFIVKFYRRFGKASL